MRKRQKQIKTLLLFSLLITLIFPYHVLASDDESGKGRMNIQSDRIIQNEKEEVYETELDRVFPKLFEDEIKTKIVEGQINNKNMKNELREEVFEGEFQANTFIDDMKTKVFTEELTSLKSSQKENDDESSNRSVSSIVFYGSIVVFIGIIVVGIFIILRKKI